MPDNVPVTAAGAPKWVGWLGVTATAYGALATAGVLDALPASIHATVIAIGGVLLAVSKALHASG
jgi:hypothetical protein